MSALPVLILLASAAAKHSHAKGVEEGFAQFGWPAGMLNGLGILEAACVVIYLIPATSVLGAILLTGYLGGATATSLRVGQPYFLQPLLGALVWGGLYMRDPRIQALLPFTKR